jgi:uncharacterized protein (DUF1330 family)
MTAYVIFIREQTTDQAELDRYGELARATGAEHPRKRLAFYGKQDILEGDPFEAAAILEFPTMEAARAWYDSPAYQEAAAHRKAGSDYRVFIVEGMD